MKRLKQKLCNCYDKGVEKENTARGLGLILNIYLNVGNAEKANNNYARAKTAYENALTIADKIKNSTLCDQINAKIKKVQR
ncbi:MAG: hypothetical protein GY853_16920 [PVC group bacterium]|nr:hypothetical protein [PVC group bacterium]